MGNFKNVHNIRSLQFLTTTSYYLFLLKHSCVKKYEHKKSVVFLPAFSCIALWAYGLNSMYMGVRMAVTFIKWDLTFESSTNSSITEEKFSNVFRGYRKETPACNGLMAKSKEIKQNRR